MPGILDYRRYLQTLQAVTDIGNTFPSTQQKFTFTVEGGATATWTASVDAKTLIVDQVSYNRFDNRPDFSNSQVIGYFEGITTGSQTTTGVIYLPGGVYAGPILPGGNVYVPVTIYNITWTDGTETFSHQLGFVQNWEPGVEIGNPVDSFDFEPIDPLPSTLTLTNSVGLDRIIFEDTLFLIAETDIPIELGGQNPVRFFKIVDGEEVLLGQSFFVGQRATFQIETNPDLPIGEYQFVAKSGGRRLYGRQTSNVFDLEVLEGIPLLVLRSEFVPDKEYYFPGDSVEHTLEVYPDTALFATGFAVTNTTTVRLIDGFPPNTTYIVKEGQFDNGINTATFITSATMVDTALDYVNTFTNFTITTSSITTSVYTATLLVWNTETVRTNWGFLTEARYARGVSNDSIQVANTTTVTVVAVDFPLTISKNTASTYFDETFEVTVNQTTATYYKPITIFASSGTTTIALTSATVPGDSVWTATIAFSNTGTWTIFASYPGDLGDSIINANLPSISNTLTHFVNAGNLLDPAPVFTYWNTSSTDVFRVWASTSTTLTNTVSFFDGATLLGTSTWVRSIQPVFGDVLFSTGSNFVSSGFARNFENLKNAYNQLGSGSLDDYGFNKTGWGYFEQLNPYGTNRLPSNSFAERFEFNFRKTNTMTPVGWASSTPDHVRSTRIIFPGYSFTVPEVDRSGYQSNMKVMDPIEGSAGWPKNPNKYRLFKYYDGSNYDLSQVTGTNIDAIADPIEFGNEWTATYTIVGSGGRFSEPIYLLDGYRFDSIGDNRGYNVVAIASTSGQRPIVNEQTPQRLYFINPFGADSAKGTSNKERFIDLVEFVGTATWQTVDYSPDHFAVSGAKTISVWLYRFTPEIPQANTQFKSSYPLDYVFYDIGGEAHFLNVASMSEYYMAYGRKKWISLNASDPVENDKAAFYNDWFWTFTNPLGTAIRTENSFITTVTNLIPSNTQTVTLTLAEGAISTTSNLTAVWTGTTNLPIEFGKFLGFNIPLTSNPTQLSLNLKNISALGYNIGDSTATEVLSTSSNIIYSYYKHKLTLDTFINPDQYPFVINTGTVSFFKQDGTLISTQPLVNGSAGIDLSADDVTNIVGQSNQSITARQSNNVFPSTSTNVINFQAIKNVEQIKVIATRQQSYASSLGPLQFTATNITQIVTLTETTLSAPYPIQYQNTPVKLIDKLLISQRYFDFASTGTSGNVEVGLGPLISITVPPILRGNRYWKVGSTYNEIFPNDTAYFLATVWYSFDNGVTKLPFPFVNNSASVAALDPSLSSLKQNSYIFSANVNQTAPSTFNIATAFTSSPEKRELGLRYTDVFVNLGGKTIQFYLDLTMWSPRADSFGQPVPLQKDAKIYISSIVNGTIFIPGVFLPFWFVF